MYQPASKPFRIRGLLLGQDVISTRRVLSACGIRFEDLDNGDIQVTPSSGYQSPLDILDCGNAGTAIRLLTGLLSPQPISAQLTGDASIRQRPMKRVIAPLLEMGANIHGENDNQNAPITIAPPLRPLHGITHTLETASAQVKSAILLAGLFAQSPTILVEPIPSRDHTERLYAGLGMSLQREGLEAGGIRWTLTPPAPGTLVAPEIWQIPGDFSSAAFFVVAAACMPESALSLTGVNLNPTRTGLLDALSRVGLCCQVSDAVDVLGEPCGTLNLESSHLKGDLTLTAPDIPALIDELPILAVAGLFLEGTLTVGGAEELRHKESDRIEAMASCFNTLGLPFESRCDGFSITGDGDGRRWAKGLGGKSITLEGHHDHRVVMSMVVLNRILQQYDDSVPDWQILGREWADISFPGFEAALQQHMTSSR